MTNAAIKKGCLNEEAHSNRLAKCIKLDRSCNKTIIGTRKVHQ